MESSSVKIRSRRSSDGEVPGFRLAIDDHVAIYQSNTFSCGLVLVLRRREPLKGLLQSLLRGLIEFLWPLLGFFEHRET